MDIGKEGNRFGHNGVFFVDSRFNEAPRGMISGDAIGTESYLRKMETVGQVAGRIAHYFNNIFAIVVGYSGFVHKGLPKNDPLRPYVHQILASSERAALLTRGLLAFTKKQVMSPKALKLNQTVITIRKLIQRILGDNIELEMDLNAENPVVWGDSVQIEQVFMNLATNARDAMPEGGTFTVRTDVLRSRVRSLEGPVHCHPWGCAVVSVRDNGVGMSEETKKRIFEPFYTTKDAGKGVGLGLSIVYGIIKQHNGSINVNSELGKGTTFTLYLPLFHTPSAIDFSCEEPKKRVQQL